ASVTDSKEMQALPGASEVRQEGDRYTLVAQEVHKTLPALLQWSSLRNKTLTSLATHTATLEDVFVKLTGRHLRDEGGGG
ncbi:MAG TPA: DUF4162 domain-containing protein, partial [Gemmatales bacterium]|nr:DUF4162 domain-containing protein [Gemmatales bacterium]